MRAIHLTVFLLLSVMHLSAQALLLQASDTSVNPVSALSVFEDITGKLTIEDITSQEIQRQFKPANPIGEELNFGFSSATHWIKLPLSILPHNESSWVLEASFAGLDHINLYSPNSEAVKTGALMPVQSRPISYRFYAFPITLTDAQQNFYLEVKSNQTISIPLKLWTRQSFDRHIQKDTLFQSFYYGGIGVLAIFNFFIFVYLRDKSHLFYSMFALLIGLGIFSGNGIGRIYIWTDSPAWDQSSQAVLLACGTAMGLLFTVEFLKTRIRFPWLEIVIRLLAYLFFIFAIALTLATALDLSKNLLYQIFPGLVIPAVLLVLFAGFMACKVGQQSAPFFLLAWGILCIGGLIASLRIFNIVPSNWFTSYALQISSALEMILLSFALASRIQYERTLRENAQTDSLASKEALVESLRASEERLERQVSLRTHDLKSMLESEKQLREQYIRFGSLISHEFRSPLGIIETQAAILTRQTGDMSQKKRLSTISSATHRLALLFDRWLQGDRLENKIDSDRPQLIQLDDWLTELIEKCRLYHPNHELTFIPNVKSTFLAVDEKMLEVVVLNLIDNACKYSEPQSIVKVKIIPAATRVGISVADHGIGIDPADHQKIFDEFVQINSNPGKKGYGLGLSFVRKAIEFYGGNIEVISTLGAGAEFIAWFPEKTLTHLD